jgi:hypothetical protein
MKYICLVCGFPGLLEPPRGKSQGGSYEICPSCGFQFGVSDDDRGFTFEQWRESWRKGGMKWSSHQEPPPDWNPLAQLKNISVHPSSPSRKPSRRAGGNS